MKPFFAVLTLGVCFAAYPSLMLAQSFAAKHHDLYLAGPSVSPNRMDAPIQSRRLLVGGIPASEVGAMDSPPPLIFVSSHTLQERCEAIFSYEGVCIVECRNSMFNADLTLSLPGLTFKQFEETILVPTYNRCILACADASVSMRASFNNAGCRANGTIE
jgi:hypothetical protein